MESEDIEIVQSPARCVAVTVNFYSEVGTTWPGSKRWGFLVQGPKMQSACGSEEQAV